MSENSDIYTMAEKLLEKEERVWLPVFYNACSQLFKGHHLPSHDHTHHMRVWIIARLLLKELAHNNHELSPAGIRKNMAAVFFHDTGMIKTLDKSHGRESALFCRQFFNDQNINLSESDKEEIITAIINHDDKEYRNSGKLKNTTLASPLKVLPVCDDLDAFGHIGIYRYTEIYLLRNIPLNALASQILPNLNSRYQNFQEQYADMHTFIKEHEQRFLIIRDFFNHMINSEKSSPLQDEQNQIIHFLASAINQQLSLKEIVSNGLTHASESVKLFCGSLFNELNQYSHTGITEEDSILPN